MNLNLSHKGLMLVGTLLVLELTFIGVLAGLLSQAVTTAAGLVLKTETER